MNADQDVLLTIEGEVDCPTSLGFTDLAQLDPQHQVPDVSRFDPQRSGDAVSLEGLLQLAGCRDSAKYLGLHGSRDNFHASIPLAAVRDRAFLIYRQAGQPLQVAAGGPLRFFIPDHAACHTDEVDECANVKFVDRIELTAVKGFDNRPRDETEHAKLHGHADHG